MRRLKAVLRFTAFYMQGEAREGVLFTPPRPSASDGLQSFAKDERVARNETKPMIPKSKALRLGQPVSSKVRPNLQYRYWTEIFWAYLIKPTKTT